VTSTNLPDESGDLLVGGVVTELLLHVQDEAENLLVGETVKGSSETAKGSRVGEEGVGESGSDKVGGVGGDVATLVVGVEGVVKTDEVDEALGVAETDLVGEVEREVLVLLDLDRVVAVAVDVVVDAGGDGERLGDAVERVVEGRLPVLGLLEGTGLVTLSELGVVVEGGDTDDELGHGVEGLGYIRVEQGGKEREGEKGQSGGKRRNGGKVRRTEGVKSLLNVSGKLRALDELVLELDGLLGGGNLAGEEVPEHALREHLLTAGSGGEDLLTLGDAVE
jgi:hypothetical protein